LEDLSRDIALGLFSRIAVGDEKAYSIIFHEYNARLFHTVLKMVKSNTEAEEIIQETFLRLWLRRHTLPEIENPMGWLYTIASNLALDALRKQAKERERLKIMLSSRNSDLPEPDIALYGKEVNELLQRAIKQLPPSRRKVFELSRNEGLSRRDIAETLHISESTVKNQLTSALHFIQDYIQKEGAITLPVTLLLLLLNFFYFR